MQNDQCLIQPWECQSTLAVFFENYWMSLILLIFFSLLASLLIITLINRVALFGKKKTSFSLKNKRNKSFITQIVIGLTSFLFFMLSPLIIVQSHYGQYGIQLTDPFLHCVILNAANECYEQAALRAVVKNTKNSQSYKNAHSICNITLSPEKCKVKVCSSLEVAGLRTSEAAAAVQTSCLNTISPTCPDGNILLSLPCSCYLPEENRVAVYTTTWHEEYWNKYRKMDKPPYCCDGITSSFLCGK
ncbi:MAG: hypothetical protein WAU07_03300 [Microgenomates group bacterium]